MVSVRPSVRPSEKHNKSTAKTKHLTRLNWFTLKSCFHIILQLTDTAWSHGWEQSPISTCSNKDGYLTSISHIRTMSTPMELLGQQQQQSSVEAIGDNKQRTVNTQCPTNMTSFADISRDKLNVHQELLVARNPRKEEVLLKPSVKSGSFRRRVRKKIFYSHFTSFIVL